MSLESLREYYTYLLTYRADEFSNLTQFVRYFTDVVSVMPNTDFSAENYGEYVQSQYDVIYGDFPEKDNEVVLVVGDSNDVIDLTLVQLGFMTEEEFLDLFISSEDGVSEDEEPASISFDEIVGKEYTLYYNDSVYVDEKSQSSRRAYRLQLFLRRLFRSQRRRGPRDGRGGNHYRNKRHTPLKRRAYVWLPFFRLVHNRKSSSKLYSAQYAVCRGKNFAGCNKFRQSRNDCFHNKFACLRTDL